MTTGPDDRPGGPESLARLCEHVPAVAVEECLEDWVRHQEQLVLREVPPELAAYEQDPVPDDVLPDDVLPDDVLPDDVTEAGGAWRLSLPQVLGLLAAELGARPLPEDG